MESASGRETGAGVGVDQQQQQYHSQPQPQPQSGNLVKQNEYLKQVITRLQHELKLHQQGQAPTQLHGTTNSRSVETTYASTEELPPWVLDSDVMTPLLCAYDSRIKELENANQRNESNVDKLQNYVNELSQENERLHSELNEANEKLLQQPLHAEEPPSHTTKPSIAASAPVQRDDYQQRYELAMKESHYLRQEVNALAEESDDLRNALQDRQSLIDTYRQKTVELGEGLQNVQQKLNDESYHRSYYEKKTGELQNEVRNLQFKGQSLETRVGLLENEKQEFENSLNKYKTALEDLSRQSEKESSDLMERLRTVNNRTKELQRKLTERDEQMDALNARFKEADFELSNARRDCEGMLRVIRSLETQLNEYKSKEEELTKREREVAEKIEEAEIQKDSALAKARADRDDVDRLCSILESHKSEAIENEKKTISTVRERLDKQLSSKQAEIDRLEQKIGEFRAEKDRALRDSASYKSDLSRIQQAYDESKRNHDNEMVSSRKRCQDEVSKQNAELQRTYKTLRAARDDLAEHENRSKESEKRKAQVESEMQSYKEELSRVRSKLDKIRSDKESANKQLCELEAASRHREQNLRLEYNRTVQSFESKVSTLQRDYDECAAALRNAEEQKERATAQLNSTLAKQGSNNQVTLTKIKKQAKCAFDESNRLQAEVERLQEQLDDVRYQYASLYKSYIEAEERAASLETALESATDEHATRSKEVADLISREEEHIHEIEKYKKHMQGIKPTESNGPSFFPITKNEKDSKYATQSQSDTSASSGVVVSS